MKLCAPDLCSDNLYHRLVKLCNEVKLHFGVFKLEHSVKGTQFFDCSVFLLGSVLPVYNIYVPLLRRPNSHYEDRLPDWVII
jgi:hypothetical protein